MESQTEIIFRELTEVPQKITLSQKEISFLSLMNLAIEVSSSNNTIDIVMFDHISNYELSEHIRTTMYNKRELFNKNRNIIMKLKKTRIRPNNIDNYI